MTEEDKLNNRIDNLLDRIKRLEERAGISVDDIYEREDWEISEELKDAERERENQEDAEQKRQEKRNKKARKLKLPL